VDAAIRQISRKLSGNFFFVEQGKTASEVAIVGVKDGKYVGFGFVDTEQGDQRVSDLLECLNRPAPDPDAGRIILNYIEKRPKGIRRWD
jgi:hypothetical protein